MLRLNSNTVIKIALLTQNEIQPTERAGAVEESIGRTICRAFPVRRQGSISAAVKQAGGSGPGLHCGSISSVWKSWGSGWVGNFAQFVCPLMHSFLASMGRLIWKCSPSQIAHYTVKKHRWQWQPYRMKSGWITATGREDVNLFRDVFADVWLEVLRFSDISRSVQVVVKYRKRNEKQADGFTSPDYKTHRIPIWRK